MKPTGYIIHEGSFRTHKYVAIATLNSENEKTGDMVQIWFLLTDVNPVQAVNEGIDADSICYGCPFSSGRGCYVNMGQAPLSIWKTYHRGSYPTLSPVHFDKAFAGRKVRFGAYGNPSLLPLSLVKLIAHLSDGWTGYFHDWRENPFAKEYAKFFMASTETESSYKLASSLGYRTFHASPNKPADAIECLADSTSGRVKCEACKLACNGLSGRTSNVWINPHGSKASKAIAVSLQ